MKSYALGALSGILAVPACLVIFLAVVLNFSRDDSRLYRLIFDIQLQSNSNNFYYGCFCVTNGDDTLKIGNDVFCEVNGCTNEITVLNNKFYKDLILKGDVGLGESYFNQYWTFDHDLYDLGDILTEFVVGITNSTQSFVAFNKIVENLIFEQWYQWYQRKVLMKKSVNEDKDSIHSHYDLGNDLFESFLDETMTYSCAFWQNKQDSLKQAQINKVDLLMNKMNINSEDNVLDIGSGWGFTAFNIFNKTNANVTGITISDEQFEYQLTKYGKYLDTCELNCAQLDDDKLRGQRNHHHHHHNTLNYRLEDYRNVEELAQLNVNKIISIGMFEHVGQKNMDLFFGIVSSLMEDSYLRDLEAHAPNEKKIEKEKEKDYVFGLHYIALHDINSQSKVEHVQTFINKYIFPGGELVVPDYGVEIARNHGFMLMHQEFFGLHYAKTLKIWRDKWSENYDQLISKNKHYDSKELYLTMEFYFAFCEALFRSGHITLVQQVFVKNTLDNNNNNNNDGTLDKVNHDYERELEFKQRRMYSRFENVYDQIVVPPRSLHTNKKIK